MRKIETRRMTTAANATGNTLSGVAVPYDQFSHVIHDRPRAYRERFKRGAMKPNPETVMLYGHDPSGVPLGRVASGSLRFRDSAEGLMFELDLPESRADIREASSVATYRAPSRSVSTSRPTGTSGKTEQIQRYARCTPQSWWSFQSFKWGHFPRH